ncbi:MULTISPECIES: hypothetical protein [unclassified Brevibacterium]|uniref:hypothetical protein n=1 Tax=unclassified Brevibacterium TaxID=2614124 RepID=UPI001E4D9B9D|nr:MULTISPECIES: hypothetical protein [unclassified Brevibacterium]MCD1285486.1 hypothetical protein [Brevibacterium sp. CCUG 69071]MDK8434536.1 hypothetical protein [Brevibacterium sp. H-BE7]
MTQPTISSSRLIRSLFVIVFSLFLITGFVLVFAQIIGLIMTNPTLVTWASNTLNVPAVVLASVSGIIAFIYTYTDKSAVSADEEE